MKKTTSLISLFLFSFSCYYSSIFFLDLEAAKIAKIEDLKTTFLFHAEKIAKEFKRLELSALKTSKTSNLSQIHKALSNEVKSILILDKNHKFLKGYTYNPKAWRKFDYINNPNENSPKPNQKWQIIDDELNGLSASYLTKRDEYYNIDVIFNLDDVSNLLKAMRISDKSFAYLSTSKKHNSTKEYQDEVKESSSRYKIKEIKLETMITDDWYIIFEGYASDLHKLNKDEIQAFFYLIILICLFLISLIVSFLEYKTFTIYGLWVFSIAFCITFLVGIYLFLFAYNDLSILEGIRKKVPQQISKNEQPLKNEIKIPTQLEILEIQNSGKSTFKIKANFIQTFSNKEKSIPPFVIEQTPNLTYYQILETRKELQNNQIIVNSIIYLELKASPQYEYYPFDPCILEFTIFPNPNCQKSIAFLETKANKANPNINIDNWNLEERLNSKVLQKNLQGVKYELVLKRDFEALFFSKFLNSILLVFLVFFCLFFSKMIIKISPWIFLPLLISFGFFMSMEHIKIRQDLEFRSLCYLDYFYFSFYLTICLVISLSLYVLGLSDKKSKKILYESLSILYWPLFLGLTLLALLVSFRYNLFLEF
jgi:hypothetical protein